MFERNQGRGFTASLLHGYRFVFTPFAIFTALLLCASIQAQSQRAPVFRARVDLLQLDVTVLDKDGKPVRGLTKDDFIILEDKQPQTVQAFTEVDIPEAAPPDAVWANAVTPDVTSNEDEGARIFVVMVDDALGMGIDPVTRMPDLAAVRAMKETVALFINSLSAVDEVGLVYTNNTRESQNLTFDHARLVKSIKAYPEDGGGILTPGLGSRMDPCLGQKYAVGAFKGVVNHLATIPDRRKAIVYLGGNLPFPILEPDPCLLKVWWDQTLEAAQQAHVVMYPIDTMGLRANGSSMDNYRSLGDMTGGRAIVANNDLAAGIRQIFLENSSYYLMAYQSTNDIADGRFRRISVTIKDRPDLEVRTRRSYWAPKQKVTDPEKAAPPPNIEALAGILPSSKLALRVTAAPFAVAGSDTSAVTLALGVRQPAFGERTPEQMELLIKAFSADGDPKGSDSQTIAVTVPAAKLGDETSRYELLARIELPKPGNYQLRLSAHSTVTDTRGSVYVDVAVPDFRKDAVSMSGVVMNSALAALPVAPRRAVRDLVPLDPTSERTFTAADIITAFVRVYQGGNTPLNAVPLAARIVDAKGTSMFNQKATLAAAGFDANRSAEYQLRLPLSTLKPGVYLLTFETTVGKTTARRDVRFAVR
jgi:VWFA-related protein